jgi:hypothetical protein
MEGGRHLSCVVRLDLRRGVLVWGYRPCGSPAGLNEDFDSFPALHSVIHLTLISGTRRILLPFPHP